MADDDEAVIVTLPDDGDGTTITKVETAKKVEDDPIADLKGQFATLQSTLHATTQRATTAEQQLAAKDQEIAAARTQVAESQLDTVASGLSAAEAEASSAEAALTDAIEKGDAAAQARAQRKLAGAESRILRLKEAKADLEDTKVAPKTETRQQPRQTAQDPVEAVALSMAPRAAAWIRSHPDYVTDRSKNSKMLATHYAALAEGVQEGGDDYFARLDAMASGGAVKKADAVADTSGRRPSSAAAPAGGSAGGMNGGGNTVTLTKREVEAATDGSVVYNFDDPNGKFKKGQAVGVQEYARRKATMQKQGLYDKSFNES
jgi:hypothetical protein